MRPFTLLSGLFRLLLSSLLAIVLSLTGTVALANGSGVEQLQQPWNALLRLHVTPEGRLNYEGLLADEDQLLGYLQSLRKVRPQAENWTPDQLKAFWLNTYNAAATNLILENYPIASINDIRIKITGGYESPWETVVVNVGGQNYSLNQIEQLLRQQFRDPRIHFALNYGAASAAPLLAESYTGPQLNQQLDQQARRFINDPAFNQLNTQQVQLSGLFRSYATEFGAEPQLLAFINRYAHVPVPATASIEYLSFSWALNSPTALGNGPVLGSK
ncbi:DUF547 domain-containing protein [Hymenobacter terrestris]|uniref:DUF547 domain-containing protein n=1 Tax=Hymenobacter terrestris TaxID=2748310 RepID=A0ABX2Q3Y9_9BACT|nr:DUF547 domain-containing protein [Hymenobacter terrestris]NVO85657.1 DUF547 domain-containing protein [Hymenobacter terrestris]